MIYQIFLSPQVKRYAIIIYKHGIYELPHELSNALILRTLGNYEISGKSLNAIGSLPAKMKILLILPKDSWKIEIKLFP